MSGAIELQTVSSQREEGKVMRILSRAEENLYGFVKSSKGEIFFHISGRLKGADASVAVRYGDTLSFELERDKASPRWRAKDWDICYTLEPIPEGAVIEYGYLKKPFLNGYSFASCGQQDIFLHADRVRGMRSGEDGQLRFYTNRPAKEPQRNQKIAFIRDQKSSRPRALFWAPR